LPAIEHKLDAPTGQSDYLDHPAGGCRMGADPATNVCDSFGQTHDPEAFCDGLAHAAQGRLYEAVARAFLPVLLLAITLATTQAWAW
jgi:hypothetical protein